MRTIDGARMMAAVLALAAALPLAGCGDRVYDSGLVSSFTGDNPPPAGPSPVRGMSGTNTDYPNLSTVPARPTDLTTEAQRKAQMQGLEKDRAASRARKKALEDQYKPLTAPPAPTITPGRPG